MSLTCIILAGGIGSRMNKDYPKVLYKVNGEIMLIRILKKMMKLNPQKIVIIVGKYHKQIKECVDYNINNINVIEYALQPEPLGTGDAVKYTIPFLLDNSNNIIINGDTPFIKTKTIRNIIKSFDSEIYDILITGINVTDPFGYGRIEEYGTNSARIIEEASCTEEQRKNIFVNTGIYVAKTTFLQKFIPELKNNNSKKEYYLTDILDLSNKIKIYSLKEDQIKEIFNINTPTDLEKAENLQKD